MTSFRAPIAVRSTNLPYIDGIIEYRENDVSERQSIAFVMDDTRRVVSLREGDDFGDTTPALKYQLDDHLGSSNLLVEADGTLVSREEYYPFGETSFGSYGKKRYRFCGKERDEESGMYYYGARYYAPWTCRFVSVDPLALKYVYQSPYAHADSNPICKIDHNGEGTGEEGGENSEATSSQQVSAQSNSDNINPQDNGERFRELVTIDENLKPKEPKVTLSDAKQQYKSGNLTKEQFNNIEDQWTTYNSDMQRYQWFQNVIDKYASASEGTIEAEIRDKVVSNGIPVKLTDGANSLDPKNELGEMIPVTNGVEQEFVPYKGPDYFKIKLDYNRMVTNVVFSGNPKTPASIRFNRLENPSQVSPSAESVLAHEFGHVFFFMDNLQKYSSPEGNFDPQGTAAEQAAQNFEYRFYKQNFR